MASSSPTRSWSKQTDYFSRSYSSTPLSSLFPRYRGSSTASSRGPNSTGYSSSFSTPGLSRFRSCSAALPGSGGNDRDRDERIRRQKAEAFERHKSTWEQLLDKYENADPEEDDEIDLVTGKVVTDRGHLRSLEVTDFGADVWRGEGEGGSDDDEEMMRSLRARSSSTMGPDMVQFDSDEDELGDWGDRSGLDEQVIAREVTPEEDPEQRRQDELLLAQFLQAEAARREMSDREDQRSSRGGSSQRRSESQDTTSQGESESESDVEEPVFRDTSRLPSIAKTRRVSVDDLFVEEGDVESGSDVEHGGARRKANRMPNGSQRRASAASTSSSALKTARKVMATESGIREATPAGPSRLQHQVEAHVARQNRFVSASSASSSPATSSRVKGTQSGTPTIPHPSMSMPRYSADARNAKHKRLATEPPPTNKVQKQLNKRQSLPDLEGSARRTPAVSRMTAQSPPVPPTHGLTVQQPLVTMSIGNTSPTLRDLFTPPIAPPPLPREASPVLRVPSHASARENPISAEQPRSRSAEGRKGKSRMAGERPNESATRSLPAAALDPKRYYSTLVYTFDKTAYRSCRICQTVGGVRGQRAVYCRGRVATNLCTFFLDGIQDDYGTEEDGLVEIPPLDLAKGSGSKSLSGSSSLSAKPKSSHKASASSVAEQSISETPPQRLTGLDPERYFPSLRASGEKEYRRCAWCVGAGGERADRSWWCRGRAKPAACTFLPVNRDPVLPEVTRSIATVVPASKYPKVDRHVVDSEDDLESISAGSADESPLPVRGRSIKLLIRTPVLVTSPRTPTSISPSTDHSRMLVPRPHAAASAPSDSSAYYPQEHRLHHGGVMSCRWCKVAGGERAERATFCKGRGGRVPCPFSAPFHHDMPSGKSSRTVQSEPVKAKGRPRGRSRKSAEQRLSKTGRAHHDGTAISSAQADKRMAVEHEHTKSHVRVIRSEPIKRRSAAFRRRHILTPDTPEMDASDEMPYSHGDGRKTTFPPSSPLERSFVPLKQPHRAVTVDDLFSPPPTGPEMSTTIEQGLHRLKPSGLEKSQTHSATRYWKSPRSEPVQQPSPAPSSSLPPSSPPRQYVYSYRAPFRTTTPLAHPTPSPSIGDYRSSSVASFHSDRASSIFPLRSSLRRPSESSDSPRSAKRTRFSLAPRSPPYHPSSDHFTGSHADHNDNSNQVQYLDDSSPLPYSHSSPSFFPHYSSDSLLTNSTFSREVSLRAADVGFNLGPAPTGRLPSGMLAALAPSLGPKSQSLSPTPPALALASRGQSLIGNTGGSTTNVTVPDPSLRAKSAFAPGISTSRDGSYAQSTSPLSFGSTTSSSSSSARTPGPGQSHTVGRSPSAGAADGATGTKGLMLPPPVPPSRLSLPPSRLSAKPPTASVEVHIPSGIEKRNGKRRDSTSLPDQWADNDDEDNEYGDDEELEEDEEDDDSEVEVNTNRKVQSTLHFPSEIRFVTKTPLSSKYRDRSRSRSMSVSATTIPTSTPYTRSGRTSQSSWSTPRRRSLVPSMADRVSERERAKAKELSEIARKLGDDAGLEWGLDEDVGEEVARQWREGSVVKLLA